MEQLLGVASNRDAVVLEAATDGGELLPNGSSQHNGCKAVATGGKLQLLSLQHAETCAGLRGPFSR